MLGKGLYGAPDPRKSLQFCRSQDKFMFICRFNLSGAQHAGPSTREMLREVLRHGHAPTAPVPSVIYCLPRVARCLPRLPLVVDDRDRILWIPGVEISEIVRLQLNTKHCLEILATCG